MGKISFSTNYPFLWVKLAHSSLHSSFFPKIGLEYLFPGFTPSFLAKVFSNSFRPLLLQSVPGAGWGARTNWIFWYLSGNKRRLLFSISHLSRYQTFGVPGLSWTGLGNVPCPLRERIPAWRKNPKGLIKNLTWDFVRNLYRPANLTSNSAAQYARVIVARITLLSVADRYTAARRLIFPLVYLLSILSWVHLERRSMLEVVVGNSSAASIRMIGESIRSRLYT